VRVQAEREIRKATKIGLCKSDIEYEGASLVKLIIASLGGGLAGAVGLGGGVVFNPVLVGMGVHPAVVSSTGMYMILFSALINSLTFWLFGNLYVNFALWLGFWSGLGIFIFLSIVGAIIKKYQRPSIIVFFLGIVIALSSILVPIINSISLVRAHRQGTNVWGFG